MINASPYVTISKEKQILVEQGHPWIFPKAIIAEHPGCTTGSMVEVRDEAGVCLAVGMYNEHSLYRVRILLRSFEITHLGSEGELLEKIIQYRMNQAISLRSTLQLPNDNTNAYRVFNSEADGLSGLIIDRFAECYVVAISAYWIMAQQSLIRRCLEAIFPDAKIIWRPQEKTLKQDGWHQELDRVAFSDIATVKEAGVLFHIDFARMQKTGLFLDQRENHQRIAQFAKNKTVLDLYTYTGGFALHAAKAGAKLVTAVDSSKEAIELAKKNAVLNQCENIAFIEADARDYLVNAGEYDIVILDPPKLVPSRKHLNKAKNYYRFLHREVFKQMKSGALLMTCNCSSALSTQEFLHLVAHQAQWAGKAIKLLGVYGPAVCHPVLPEFPEGRYLTALLLAIV